MSLSSKSNSQASPQKKIKWYTQVFNVKWLTDTQLKDKRQLHYVTTIKITVTANVVRLLLKMQTNPCYFHIKNQNETNGAIKLQKFLVAFLSFC